MPPFVRGAGRGGVKSLAGTLAAPFPWFGGKSLACTEVWAALGDPENYVEPFAGSAAMLLGREEAGKVETINDADGFVANFWRAIAHDRTSSARVARSPPRVEATTDLLFAEQSFVDLDSEVVPSG